MSALHSLLFDPDRESVDLVGLGKAWRMTRIELLVPGAAKYFHGPNGPAKLRGAWGHALAVGASTEVLLKDPKPCPWSVPCAYSVFLVTQGRHSAGQELPKPFVIALESDGPDLLVQMTLFGEAGDWAGEAADGLTRALKGGIDLVGDRRVTLSVADRRIDEARGLPLPDHLTAPKLEFQTPVQLRQGDDVHADPSGLVRGLGLRLAGLARWHGLRLELDIDALVTATAEMGARAQWQDAEAEIWVKGARMQNRRLTLAGLCGCLCLPDVLDDVARIVTFGETCHAGARTSHGLGRYHLLARATVRAH